jgi:hypothetical protein
MDQKMRENLIQERLEYRKQEMERIKWWLELMELKEKDPEEYKRRMKLAYKWFIWILFLLFCFFLCFRLYDACWVPDSICDFEWWWTFGKKCYECSVKWVFYLEKRKIPENKKLLFMTDEECNNYLKDCHKRVAEEQLDLICVCPWRSISVSADDNESDDLDNE